MAAMAKGLSKLVYVWMQRRWLWPVDSPAR